MVEWVVGWSMIWVIGCCLSCNWLRSWGFCKWCLTSILRVWIIRRSWSTGAESFMGWIICRVLCWCCFWVGKVFIWVFRVSLGLGLWWDMWMIKSSLSGKSLRLGCCRLRIVLKLVRRWCWWVIFCGIGINVVYKWVWDMIIFCVSVEFVVVLIITASFLFISRSVLTSGWILFFLLRLIILIKIISLDLGWLWENSFLY